MRKIGLLSAVAASVLVFTPAFAEESVALTEDMIKDFYHQSAQMQKAPADQIVAFTDKHTHPDARFTINMVTRVPGALPQENDMVLNKVELLDVIKKSQDSTEIQEISNSVIRLNIEEGGRRARVTDTNYIAAKGEIPTPNGPLRVNSETTGLCNDVIELAQDSVIQLVESRCQTEVTLKPIQ